MESIVYKEGPFREIDKLKEPLAELVRELDACKYVKIKHCGMSHAVEVVVGFAEEGNERNEIRKAYTQTFRLVASSKSGVRENFLQVRGCTIGKESVGLTVELLNYSFPGEGIYLIMMKQPYDDSQDWPPMPVESASEVFQTLEKIRQIKFEKALEGHREYLAHERWTSEVLTQFASEK